MAVPGAVARRAERDREELRAQGIDPDTGTPVEVQAGAVPAVSTPAVAPAVPETEGEALEELRAKLAETQAALETQNGRASAAATDAAEARRILDTVQQNRQFLESQLTTLTEQVQALQTANEQLSESTSASSVQKIVAGLDVKPLTPQQIEAFGDDSVGFVTQIVKNQLAEVVKPMLERLAQLEKGVSRVKEIDGKLPQLETAARVASIESARSKELQFIREEVLPYYPTFEKDRTTQPWKDFLQKEVPGKGFKYAHLLQSYRETSNAVGIRTILEAFYLGRTPSKTLDSLAVPAKTNADAPPAPAVAKIKASEYKTKLKDFTSKRLSKADWEAFRDRWDKAIASGDVEMDVEIR